MGSFFPERVWIHRELIEDNTKLNPFNERCCVNGDNFSVKNVSIDFSHQIRAVKERNFLLIRKWT